jgi:hypothetical protein
MKRTVTRHGNVKCFPREQNSRSAPIPSRSIPFPLFCPWNSFLGSPVDTDGIATSYGLDGEGFESQHVQHEFSTLKPPRPALVPPPPATYLMGTKNLSWGYTGRGVNLTTYFRVAPRSGKSGAVSLLPLYAFRARAGSAFLILCFCHGISNRTPSLFNGYRVFTGGKAAGVWRWPPTPI